MCSIANELKEKRPFSVSSHVSVDDKPDDPGDSSDHDGFEQMLCSINKTISEEIVENPCDLCEETPSDHDSNNVANKLVVAGEIIDSVTMDSSPDPVKWFNENLPWFVLHEKELFEKECTLAETEKEKVFWRKKYEEFVEKQCAQADTEKEKDVWRKHIEEFFNPLVPDPSSHWNFFMNFVVNTSFGV